MSKAQAILAMVESVTLSSSGFSSRLMVLACSNVISASLVWDRPCSARSCFTRLASRTRSFQRNREKLGRSVMVATQCPDQLPLKLTARLCQRQLPANVPDPPFRYLWRWRLCQHLLAAPVHILRTFWLVSPLC